MKAGTVKFWNDQKGFGFITDGNQDYFIHATNLIPANTRLKEGATVEFEIRPGKKGEEAFNCKMIK